MGTPIFKRLEIKYSSTAIFTRSKHLRNMNAQTGIH